MDLHRAAIAVDQEETTMTTRLGKTNEAAVLNEPMMASLTPWTRLLFIAFDLRYWFIRRICGDATQ